MIGIVLYARWLGTRYPDFMPQEEEAPQDLRAAHQQYLAEKEGKALPSLMLSLLPILTPIGLIFVNAVNNMLAKREGMGWLAESLWGQSFAFLGSPMIALAISVLLAVYTLMPHANKHDTLERLEEGLQTAGIILWLPAPAARWGGAARERRRHAAGAAGRRVADLAGADPVRHRHAGAGDTGIRYGGDDHRRLDLGTDRQPAARRQYASGGAGGHPGALFFSYFNDSMFWVVNRMMGIRTCANR